MRKLATMLRKYKFLLSDTRACVGGFMVSIAGYRASARVGEMLRDASSSGRKVPLRLR